ncbi:MAG TPA: 50S ribosomal protein L24 [Gammaproteobacteria bacterium]|nr:50S ribosomal protein L24 [Gammaproteobacteria bacterium]
MRKIRKGDDVIVIAGKDKGKTGNVNRVVSSERIIVDGVNMVKRHTKGNPQQNIPGGIIDKEAPIHISNVMIYNSSTGKGDRVGFKTLEDGVKVRTFKSSGEQIDA